MSTYQYENVYIGAFIYTFGCYAGARGLESAATFSNYQQTPKDAKLGDLFANWQGKNFLVEFKREEKLIKNEWGKSRKKELLEALNSEGEANVVLSEKGHFMCVPNGSSLGLLRYKEIMKKPKVFYSFESFVKAILSDSSSVGLTYDELKTYLNFIKQFSEEEEDDSVNVSGVVVNIDKEGKINFIEYDNAKVLEKVMTMEKELTKEKNKNKGLGKG